MIGDRIKNIRKERRLTQDDLSEMISASRQTISHWEIGRSEPNVKDIIELAKALDISSDYLLEITGIKEKYTYDKKLHTYINDCIEMYHKYYDTEKKPRK